MLRINLVATRCLAPTNPVHEDPLWALALYHTPFPLGAKELSHETELPKKPAFSTWEQYERWLSARKTALVIPVYMFETRGGEWWISRFPACGSVVRDWGKIGFAYTSKGWIRKYYDVPKVTPEVEQRAAHALDDLLNDFTKFIDGEVYDLTITGDKGEDYITNLRGWDRVLEYHTAICMQYPDHMVTIMEKENKHAV